MRAIAGTSAWLLVAMAGVAVGQGPVPPGGPIEGGPAIEAPAAGAEATGRVQRFEPERRVLTLDNGDTYVLAANAPGTETLTPGLLVRLTYTLDGANKIVREVRTITTAPDADTVRPPVN